MTAEAYKPCTIILNSIERLNKLSVLLTGRRLIPESSPLSSASVSAGGPSIMISIHRSWTALNGLFKPRARLSKTTIIDVTLTVN